MMSLVIAGRVSMLGTALPCMVLALGAALGCEELAGDASSRSCFECPPIGGACVDGVLTYRYSWGSGCSPDEGCGAFSHGCALGCREEGAREDQQSERVFMLCEESSLRSAGFPCRHDVNCVSPIGATETSRLPADAGSEQVSTTGAAQLVCGGLGVCEAAVATNVPTDVGNACSAETSRQHPGPVVVGSDSCQSGACLVLEGGSSQGFCSLACSAGGGLPCRGYACTDVLDSRYVRWGNTGHGIAPPRITACVPSAG